MDTIKIRQGETLELTITADDASAQTVQLIVAETDGTVLINETESFTTTGGVTTAVISTTDTDHAIGDYEYMLVITYSDGFIEKLPDASSCDEDCDLPTFTICKSLEVGVS